ncbi:FAD-binding oxidoreductase [Extensimonas vulgaris]|uniref:FAD/FMN-containing dehydrogenase n=1 Tax=Extensimonas vulgaris TaxID=1031594 RepID=A0A369AHK9_9BURK|nr:FAD-binding oxidoreductase [Extensimonas vulgaris]RCX08575.1 FAD/FMN-containing dehydrogenase [Extensimonas vulgaris]TWI36190.1 FAD/FMN-containing dehydrogenase [Extensimonas vulgaris]TXD14027.1 FAD-binding oxidoreductase [Extensimonas vulgaris]
MSDLLHTLRQIVGPAEVHTEGDLSAWEQDWRRRARGKALAVVRPATTQQVAAVVRACAAAGTPIVPQGGNTGLSLGATPDASGREIVLSLTRLNTVRAVDPANLTLTAEAGCLLHAVQDAAAQAGLLFPLSLASEGSCTIGGNLATNAGGTQVLRYGNARELCLGLEVVTAQGEVWSGLRGLRKDNTGYDLRDLFIGSEGTLGIITAATLKLFPRPAAQLTAWAAVPSLAHAVTLLALAHQHLDAGLTAFEAMGRFALQLVQQHLPQLRVPFVEHPDAPWCVLLENSDSESADHARARFEALMESALAQGCISDAVVAENLTQAQQLWQIREGIPLAQAKEGLNIKHDIAVPISRIADFVAHTDALLTRELPGVRLVTFGHLGDGNLHYNVQAPQGCDAQAFLQAHEAHVNALVYDAVAQFGGSFSAEHGVGALKVRQLQQYQSPVALGLMRTLKRALDPQNVLNPGRVLV